MKTPAFILILGIIISTFTNAQDVITTTGDSLKNKATVVNWTIGEVFIETFSKNKVSTTLGFNQPVFSLTSILEKNKIKLSIFPNPTSQLVHIKFDGKLPSIIKILTIEGKLLSFLEIKEQTLKLDFSKYQNGIYIVEIFDESGYSYSYQIIKH